MAGPKIIPQQWTPPDPLDEEVAGISTGWTPPDPLDNETVAPAPPAISPFAQRGVGMVERAMQPASTPPQVPVSERPKEGVEFFEYYLGPEYKPMTNMQNGGRVYKNQKTGELAYWSPQGETFDKKSILKIMTGKPEAEVLKGRKRELVGSEIMRTDPIGTRVRQTVSGRFGYGEAVDELAALRAKVPGASELYGDQTGAEATEAYRAQLAAFEADRPIEAGLYKLLGGITSFPAAALNIPMTAGRGFLQKAITGTGSGAVLGGVEGALSGFGRGETMEERKRLAGEGAQLGALVGGVVGGGIEVVAPVVGNVGRLVTSTDVGKIAKEFGVSRDAATRLQSAFVRADFAEARRILNEAGETGMLADAGIAARNLLDSAIIQGSDEAASTALRKVDPRLAFQFRKLTAVADRVLGKARGMGEVLEDIQGQARATQKQLYESAYANVIDPAIPSQRVVSDQIAKQVDSSIIDAVNASYRVAATDPNAIRQIVRKVDPQTGQVTFDPPLTVGDVDKITRIMQDSAQKLHKDVNPLAFGVSALKSEQGKDLEGLVGRIRTGTRTQFDDYDLALKTSKDTIKQREAAMLGEELLKPSTTREHVAEALAAATPEERIAMKAGLRSAVDELRANARASASDPDADISALNTLFNKFMMPSSKEKVAALLGPDDARRLMETLNEAKIALQTKQGIVRGSQTGMRLAIAEKDKMLNAPSFADFIARAEYGKAFSNIMQTLTATRPQDLLARSEEAWDEVAGMLTSMQGADAKRALDILEKAMAGQKATNKNAKFVADFIRKMRAPAIVGAEGANQSLRYNPETGETE
jgi:hypothetical protein